MNTTLVAEALHEGLMVAVKLAGPILLGCMVIGLLLAIFQAVTQIHEQALGFILKMLAVMTFLTVAGGWMMRTLQEYVYYIFELML